MKARVMAAMSGGVDSAVAAFLLKYQGFKVTGVTMCLGVEINETGKIRCCGPQEIEDARRVCESLGISHHVLDFAPDLKDFVIDPFLSEYGMGRTPNPCIECNRHIKFGSLLKKALAMGFDYLATGHYAGIQRSNGNYRLVMPKDNRKDQTYFLSGMPRGALEHVLFPLSNLFKDEVREIAQREGLPVSSKPESQDLCFIPEGKTEDYLRKNISSPPGDIIDLSGKVLGTHRGLAFYTIGQRARMSTSRGKPLYVIAKDTAANRIIIGEREHLSAKGLIAGSVNLLVDSLPEKAFAKIRYAHSPAGCRVSFENGRLTVLFNESQEAITPGQSVALYDKGVILGSGIIQEVIS
ncbi:MAG: tRNA 2-thiouridine(34) synthase MnmA [Pseudomonadota bacterium]|nr:tRNA 2-thiouridine(34) synthase MnmA [Pseudomonadota bacterium]